VFEVLSDVLHEQPLRNLLIEAIRYGDQRAVGAKLDIVIDETVGIGINKPIADRVGSAS